jgi:hypothetical protein
LEKGLNFKPAMFLDSGKGFDRKVAKAALERLVDRRRNLRLLDLGLDFGRC